MRRVLAAFFVLLLLVMAVPASAQVYYFSPGPAGALGISRPRLGLRVQTTDADRVLSAVVTVDGVAHPAQSDGDYYYYQPTSPLAPGPHTAGVHVELSGSFEPLDESWQFSVGPNAIADFPPPGAAQRVALEAVNGYRRLADLAPVTLDPALTAAAQSHARYFLLNPSRGLSPHFEQPDGSGYTGAKPIDRGSYFGFMTAGFYKEDMDFISDHRLAVQEWTDSVYHRFQITDPNLFAVGYGFAADGQGGFANVLDAGAALLDPPALQVVVYPMPGQRGVPLDFVDREEPDPLRLWGADYSGYPLTLQFAQHNLKQISVSSATLADAAGQGVPIWVNTPENDEHLENQVALLPRVALAAGTRYVATVTGTAKLQDGSAQAFRKAWWFTTEGATSSLVSNPGITVTLGGLPLAFDVPPALENDRTLVPLRTLFETLGATVSWDPARYAVTSRSPLHKIRLKIGNDRALVDDRDVLLDAPPLIIGDRTLVPLRFVAEALGLKVAWDPNSRTVNLTGG